MACLCHKGRSSFSESVQLQPAFSSNAQLSNLRPVASATPFPPNRRHFPFKGEGSLFIRHTTRNNLREVRRDEIGPNSRDSGWPVALRHVSVQQKFENVRIRNPAWRQVQTFFRHLRAWFNSPPRRRCGKNNFSSRRIRNTTPHVRELQRRIFWVGSSLPGGLPQLGGPDSSASLKDAPGVEVFDDLIFPVTFLCRCCYLCAHSDSES